MDVEPMGEDRGTGKKDGENGKERENGSGIAGGTGKDKGNGERNSENQERERVFGRRSKFFRGKPTEIEAELRFEYIEANVGKYDIRFMCEMLEVSRSGYYKHLIIKAKPDKNAIILSAIMKILEEDIENENYGKIRMYERLKQDGHKCCQARVSQIMDKNGLRVSKKRKPNGLTKSDKEAQASDNLIKGDFTAEKPNEKCVTDITQVPTADGNLYVSVIFDCYDNSAWGLEMADNMRAELVSSSLENAVRMNPAIRKAILHSDRGSQYTSNLFRETLDKFGITQSMNSAAGRCYDNAKCESMWGRFKEEKLYKTDTSKMTMTEVKSMIWRYFYSYWNNRRICSAIGGMAPMTKRRLYFDSIDTKNIVA
jgi:transposase InsO family protein